MTFPSAKVRCSMAFQEATCSFKAGQITQFEKQSSWERTRFPPGGKSNLHARAVTRKPMSFQSWNQNSAVEMLTVSKTPSNRLLPGPGSGDPADQPTGVFWYRGLTNSPPGSRALFPLASTGRPDHSAPAVPHFLREVPLVRQCPIGDRQKSAFRPLIALSPLPARDVDARAS
jgi:hypothetical protein